MNTRRPLLAVALAALVATAALARAVEASVVRPQSFENLVDRSSHVLVGEPIERTSVWEEARIVTYTRVEVRETIAGPREASIWVRTLGGEVGDLGQRVEGEASLELGKLTLLFLERASAGTFAVAARAQGQFFLETRPTGRQLRPHPSMGAFMTKGPHDVVRPVADRLRARFVEDVARDIRARWEATHAGR